MIIRTTAYKLFRILFFCLILFFAFGCINHKNLSFDTEATIEGAGEWTEYKNEIAEKLNIEENNTIADTSVSEKALTELNFGITPWDKEENLRKWWTPILKYLSEKLNIKVVFNLPPDYGTLQEDLKRNSIQLASFSPSAFGDALLSMPDDMKYVASVEVNEKEFYEGYIFTKKDSKIQSLEDMKGKTIGFTDLGSASGYKYPVALLLGKNINPEKYFSRILFLGEHDKVLQSVFDGNVEIGATFDTKYNVFQTLHNDPFKIVIKTAEIPYDALATSKYVSDGLIEKIINILLEIDENTKLKDGSPVLVRDKSYDITGFTVKNTSFYDVVVETSNLIKEYEKSKNQ